jgi:hypothetical protein
LSFFPLRPGSHRQQRQAILESTVDRSRILKRPPHANRLAKLITDLATGQASDTGPTPEQEGKDPAAVSLGRRGGLKAGRAPAEKLTPEQRQEIARKAAAPSEQAWG